MARQELARFLRDRRSIVTSAAYDVVAWNPLAEAMLGALRGQPNLARRRFLHREEVLTTGHEEFGEIAVARLRAAADRYPRDAAIASLLAELRAGNPASSSARALRHLALSFAAR